MDQDSLAELAQKLMDIKGEVRGVVFKTDAEFVLREKGKKGLSEVEKELVRIGHPIDYKTINTMGFYPIGLRVLSLIAIKKVLNLDAETIKEIGAAAPKISLIIKLFMQYFLSIKKTAAQVPKMWKKHYTIGEPSVETHERERYAILRLEDFVVHPILCCYLSGYFSTVIQMIVKAPVISDETKCPFRGDKFHEFLLKW